MAPGRPTAFGSTAADVEKALRALADPAIAAHSKRFFKTGPGEYGDGDEFLGIRVPELRKQARAHQALPIAEVVRLLRSPLHEQRLCALLILVRKFQRGDARIQTEVYRRYLENKSYINNWDLVDASAHLIVGAYLERRGRAPLYRLARSKRLWDRRIAIISTLCFIRSGEFEDTLALSKLLLSDPEDLIHKAVGWMLREVGNRDRSVERAYLRAHYARMPRTMLRYAIEKLPEAERQRFLRGSI